MGSHKKRNKEKLRENLKMFGSRVVEDDYAKGKGTSRHDDKQNNETNDKIYSYETARNYHRWWNYFCDWIKTSGWKLPSGNMPRSIEDAKLAVPDYIEYLKTSDGKWGRKKSAYTIRAYFAAVAKVLGISASDYDLPSRHRDDIMRSRTDAQSKEINKERNAGIINFCRCVGLRSHKELEHIHGYDLHKDNDGIWYVHIERGKGGKQREVRVYGSDKEIDQIVSMMQVAGDNLVFPQVPKHLDVHGLRAEYASRLYTSLARPVEELHGHDRYVCRGGEMSGVVFDREAMNVVSKNLGHNRESVIAGHYLWKV